MNAARALRQVTRYTHFANGWIRTARDPELREDDADYRQTLRYGYDKRGFQTSWTSEPKGRVVERTFAPNGVLDRREAYRGPNDTTPRTYEYDYNANHSLIAMVDKDPGRPAGEQERITRTEVDGAERPTLVNERWPRGRDTTFRYDANGNVTRRQTDGRFLPTAENLDRYDGGRTTAFTYDPLDRETRTIVCPDPAGACTESTANARVTATDWFDSGDKSLVTKANGVKESRFWNNDGRLARMKRVTGAGAGVKNQPYTYDANGNRTRDERGTHVFNPRDGLIRWTRAKAPAGTDVFYDLTGSGAIDREEDEAGATSDYQYVGDRLDKVVVSDAGVSVTADYRYDDFGSLTKIDTDSGDTEFVYDEYQRLLLAKGDAVPADQAGDRYCYDGFDRRDLRIEGAAEATCSNPGAGGAKTYEYSYIGLTEQLSREQRSDGSARTYDYDSAHERLGRSAREGTQDTGYRSYAADANGSVEGLETGAGTVPERDSYTYDPYGKLESRSGDPDADPESELDPDAHDNPFRFRGFHYDRAVGGYDMQAREYLPEIGRFLTQDRYEDPTGDLSLLTDPMTHNRYAFVGGNPVSVLDFDGHEPPHGSYVNAPDDYYGESSMSADALDEERRRERLRASALSPDSGDRNHRSVSQEVSDTSATLAIQRQIWRDKLAEQAQDRGFWDYMGNDFGGDMKGLIGTDLGFGRPESKTYQEGYAFYSHPATQVVITFVPGIGALSKASKVRQGVRAATSAAGSRSTARGAERVVGGACSFSGPTSVLMADGARKPIEDIRVGDEVFAADPVTGERGAREVTHVWVHRDRVIRLRVGDELIVTTPDHPFWNETEGEWQAAADLAEGDVVGTADGRTARVRTIDKSFVPTTRTFNLTVNGIHTFHVGSASLLVHNWCPIQGSGSGRASGIASQENSAARRLQNAFDDDWRGVPNPIGDGSALDAARHTVRTGDLVGGTTHLEKTVEMRNRYARILRRGGLSRTDEMLARSRFRDYDDFVRENRLEEMMQARGLG